MSLFFLTGKLKPIQIDVLQRDNRTVRQESFRPVFTHSKHGRPYLRVEHFDKYFWTDHLVEAGVRPRGVSLCRHTFTSHMLAIGLDVRWICDQLGHTSDAMIRKRYAKHFKHDRLVNPADIANKQLGFT